MDEPSAPKSYTRGTVVSIATVAFVLCAVASWALLLLIASGMPVLPQD